MATVNRPSLFKLSRMGFKGWKPLLYQLPVLLLIPLLLLGWGWRVSTLAAQPGQIRTYYIAADEVDWNYVPTGSNQITGLPFTDEEKVFVQADRDRIGTTYRKAIYREYTDNSFTQLKPRAEDSQYLGLLGPVIRAEVGDTIRVEFKNNTHYPTSVHPHGVFYEKDSEGAPYQDGSDSVKVGNAVPPGGQHIYTWLVPERAGPGPHDPSSILWMYHSHTNEVKDTYSGLIGPLIVTRQGFAKPDGSPQDVDREVMTLLLVSDENQSWYLDENIRHSLEEAAEHLDIEDEEFEESNLMHSINGYVYGNMPMPVMKKGDRVRWYLLGMGTEVDLHTPHWHGNTGLMMGMRMDMVDLLPGDMKTIDFVPDNVGTWLFHCHVNDHISAGMQARYRVVP
ncbi:MAG TPA: multicopper oxidase domain-containing protein [Crinalium sp.]